MSEIAADGESRSIGLFSLWSIIHTDSSVGYILATVIWYLLVPDVVDSVGALLSTAYPLRKPSEFIRKGCRPHFTIFGTLEKVSIFHRCSGV
jgi:hypothetical protein